MVPGAALIQLSLTELLQQQQELVAIGEGRGRVRVGLNVTGDSGRAILSFHLPDARPGRGYLSGNVHIALHREEAQQIFCLLLRSLEGTIFMIPPAHQRKLRLSISRLRVAELEQLSLMLLTARQ